MVRRLVGIKVVYRAISLPAGAAGATVCIVNPSDCGTNCLTGVSGPSGLSGISGPSGSAPGGIQTACSDQPVGNNLLITFANGTGAMACMNGMTVAVDYNISEARWMTAANVMFCGQFSNGVYLDCSGGIWRLYTGLASCNVINSTGQTPPTITSNPWGLHFTGLFGSPACMTGTIDATVEEV